MKQRSAIIRLAVCCLFIALAPAAWAGSTWYVDGVNGNDNNDCLSSQTACQTIGHAIARTHWNDVIMVAPATYVENLTISKNLKILGSDAATTIIDGNGAGSVVTISNASAYVELSKLTIRNGSAPYGNQYGGGINNAGTLDIENSIVSGNQAWRGGGISTSGKLTVSNCTVSLNSSEQWGGGILNLNNGPLTINKSVLSGNSSDTGGGIYNLGMLTVTKSTLSGNSSATWGGGIVNMNGGTLKVSRSTFSGNSAGWGGGIYNYTGPVTISNSTFSGNSAIYTGGGITNPNNPTLILSNTTLSGNGSGVGGGGIYGFAILQNSIVANSPSGQNCTVAMTSNGYNLSDDLNCYFSGPGDMNNTNPKLGPLGNYGGPTQTIPLRSGSPAIDAGDPNGCTDGNGNLLTTDQRGYLRPDKRHSGGCDIGAFERQIP